MSQVVEQLAALTAVRDRDTVDTTLVGALRDLLRPQLVAIYRAVGDAADSRWLTHARLGRHDTVASGDPLWTELKDLPRLDNYPARLQALRQQRPVQVGAGPQTTVFPLSADRETMAVLELRSDGPLDADALRLADSILRIYRNFQALLDYSERDTLTGLLNRKTFDEAFYKAASTDPELMPAEPAPVSGDERRQSPPLALPHFVGVIDIDHFKSVNDTYGHLIGDEVLLLLSRLMRSVFRFHDRLYRFGGEEFVVLMRCAGDAEAGLALERLRSSVKAFAFPQVGSISVSVGYTRAKPGDTPSSAFERADRAVYWAKGHGRDQVCSHAALVARGDLADDSKVGDVELF